MAAALDKTFAFIHVPKTGGASVKVALWEWLEQRDIGDFHPTAIQLEQEMGKDAFWSAYKFSLVRNPWDRMVSCFFFWKTDTFAAVHPQLHKKYKNKTFHEWLINHVEPSQTYWLVDREWNPMVDFVGRFENINQDWKLIRKNIKHREALPHENTTQHKHYTEYYDNELNEIIFDRYKDEIMLFGYKFGKPAENFPIIKNGKFHNDPLFT